MSIRPSRRWLRYSLRTLLVLVTVFCLWLGWQVRIVHKRKAALREIEDAGGGSSRGTTPYLSPMGEVRRAQSLPFWRHWIGDENVVSITWPDKFDESRKT